MSRSPLLDLLIVGGGPAGVAAALRAKELGLSALIIETDDVLRRIRDYSKDKLILPGFGGGDKMAFPDGGDWIAKLAFEPIDKDDLCAHWKTLCQQAEAPWRLATELLGLEDDTDGNTPIFRARIYDHRRRQEGTYRARHVALALGRGVPRRFDIPGDTTGIALRLDDPTTYVGAPACVIGGGTSAAEAVIAISNAKAASSDPTPIVWSYRGDRLPRVSKALAEVFFEAYAGNGNIRYHPSSEPLMVAPGPDRRLHLALRVDRRVIDGRAVETTLLEFPTEVCIACIGEDLPKTFLESLGIVMVRGGARGRERMVVNRLLETCRPRVYLMGDILSQAYLEAEDFAATPSTFREIRHRGNIKSALHDGVRVAEVVAQRVAGVDADAVEVAERAAVATAPPTAEPAAPSVVQSITASIKIPASMLQESGATEMLPKAALRSAWLVRLLPGGVDDNDHTLDPGSTTTLGRRGCDLSFPDDTLLSERAASITLGADGAVLRDEGSENGVFVQLPSRNKIELRPGDLLRAGRQFLVVEHDTESGTFSIVHYRSDGSAAGRHPVPDGSLVLGRRADLSLDREDASLSRRQMALTSADGRLLAKDLLSANGTYLRVQ
ncbi:MAG: FAD-dependent oxidoreductase, partial [Acidobacteriota bacterium]